MKDVLRGILASAPRSIPPRNALREYLQARILGVLQAQGAFIPLAFMGGTALRFLYDLPRFSEDLDFALENPDTDYDLDRYANAMVKTFELEGYDMAVRTRAKTTVQKAEVRWRGLLYELGLSPHSDETFMIRFEVDTRPPENAGLEVTVVERYQMLQLQHHDRASLMAGKIAALLLRNYLKGRDVYDLVWYLNRRNQPPPNLDFLREALSQQGRSDLAGGADTWPNLVRQRLREADWEAVVNDLSPLIERRADLDLMTFEVLDELLDRTIGSVDHQGDE